MSTSELKSYVDARTPVERRWLARYLWEMERQNDGAHLAELDRRMDEMDEMAAGKSRLTWEEWLLSAGSPIRSLTRTSSPQQFNPQEATATPRFPCSGIQGKCCG